MTVTARKRGCGPTLIHAARQTYTSAQETDKVSVVDWVTTRSLPAGRPGGDHWWVRLSRGELQDQVVRERTGRCKRPALQGGESDARSGSKEA